MTGPAAGAHDLDLYDAAFLAGGPARVVDTALVALVRAGKLRIHSPGQLATADLTRRHPVEAAVLDAVGPTGHRSVDTIRWRLADAEVARVALGGRAAMTDTRLRTEVFEQSSTALVPGRRSRSVDHSDPRLRAYRPGGPSSR